MMTAPSGEIAWRALMRNILDHGSKVAPRGQPTLELMHTNHLQVSMAKAVVTSPLRKLNYRFMAAEALWILSGDNRLDPLTRFVKRMADFSDDGMTLAGAYGPPVVDQLGYVVRSLLADRDTRQAVLTLWRPRPGPSKDIPCTVAMAFAIRENWLHQQVYMRSSDAWLGIPYDIFSFSCIGLKVACELNRLGMLTSLYTPVRPGVLTVTAASSHLYERDLEQAEAVLAAPSSDEPFPVDVEAVAEGRWAALDKALVLVRDIELAKADHDGPRPYLMPWPV